MSDSSIISGLQHIKRAKDFFEVFANTCQGGRGAALMRGYIGKLNFILRDFSSTPDFSQEVRDALRMEYQSDTWEVDDLCGKMALVPANQRDFVEKILDMVISGEQLKIMEEK